MDNPGQTVKKNNNKPNNSNNFGNYFKVKLNMSVYSQVSHTTYFIILDTCLLFVFNIYYDTIVNE